MIATRSTPRRIARLGRQRRVREHAVAVGAGRLRMVAGRAHERVAAQAVPVQHRLHRGDRGAGRRQRRRPGAGGDDRVAAQQRRRRPRRTRAPPPRRRGRAASPARGSSRGGRPARPAAARSAPRAGRSGCSGSARRFRGAAPTPRSAARAGSRTHLSPYRAAARRRARKRAGRGRPSAGATLPGRGHLCTASPGTTIGPWPALPQPCWRRSRWPRPASAAGRSAACWRRSASPPRPQCWPRPSSADGSRRS